MDLIRSDLVRELDVPPTRERRPESESSSSQRSHFSNVPNDQIAPSNHFALRPRVHSLSFDHHLLTGVDHAFRRVEFDDLAIQAEDRPFFPPSVLLERVDEVDVRVVDQLAAFAPREPLVMDLLHHEDHRLEDAGSALVTGIREDDPRARLPPGLDVDLDLLDLGLPGEQAGRDPICVCTTLEQLFQRKRQRVDPLCGDRPLSS